jgi:hypothetical protein
VSALQSHGFFLKIIRMAQKQLLVFDERKGLRNGSFASTVSDRACIGRGRRQSLGSGNPPHSHHAPLACFGIPYDDRQGATHAIGDNLVAAVLSPPSPLVNISE